LQVLTPALLRAAHRQGVEVHVWTVNEPETMRRLVRAGVDGIVSDRADVAVEVLREIDPPRRP
jgi:glycerophosphoryl diester phosphodiesterase